MIWKMYGPEVAVLPLSFENFERSLPQLFPDSGKMFVVKSSFGDQNISHKT